MADWIYPVNEKSDRWGEAGDVLSYFADPRPDNWGLSTNYHQIVQGDRVWVYATSPHRRIVGIGTFMGNPRQGRSGAYRIDIEWDRETCVYLASREVRVPDMKLTQSVRRADPTEISFLERVLRGIGATASPGRTFR